MLFAYWTGYTADVDKFVKDCSTCCCLQSQNRRPAIKEIASSTEYPYEHIAIDLTGPSGKTNNKLLLTIIDLYSRYPEVYVLNRGTSSEVISCLKESFSRFGFPTSLQSDNGTVFISHEISVFLNNIGVKHIKSSNYHPMSYGCIERFHKTLIERIARIQLASDADFYTALSRTLLDIRTTPNAMTGQTPVKIFLGREIRTKESLLMKQTSKRSAPTRSARDEYSKLFATKIRSYSPGDLVVYRKGQSTFQFVGKVVDKINDVAYRIIDIDSGREATYNVRDLKPYVGNKYNSLQEALEAYDNVIPVEPQMVSVQDRLAVPRYNLRPRTVSPAKYRK